MDKNYWRHQIGIGELVQLNWPFVNLGIGTSTLELEMELKLELIQQTPLFPVPLGLWKPNLAG